MPMRSYWKFFISWWIRICDKGQGQEHAWARSGDIDVEDLTWNWVYERQYSYLFININILVSLKK